MSSRLAAAVVVAAALVVAAPAAASQLIDRNATGVRLQVDAQGRALLTYTAGGKLKHVLALGAVNALPPSAGARQVKFRLDYSGGWGLYRKTLWQTFRNACRPYDGPPIPLEVTACKAPDGSYWAVQNFAQPLTDLGFTPWTADQRAVWLELSHWKGPLPQLEVMQDWVYSGRFSELVGRFTYDGAPVFGFGTTRYGAPTDGFGRLIYLDTLDAAAYGAGWRRENSFVPHNPTGVFCYGFYTFDPTRGGYQHPPGETAMRGPGTGKAYRLIAQGPGVTPDVMWTGSALGRFDASSGAQTTEDAVTAQLRAWGDRSCMPGH
jgi:hypothetical protein